MAELACQWSTPQPCQKQVVAKIGLPGSHSIWVCKRHFDIWQEMERQAREGEGPAPGRPST